MKQTRWPMNWISLLWFQKILVFQNVFIAGLSPYFISPPGKADVVSMTEDTLTTTPIYLVKVGDPDPGDILSVNLIGTSDFILHDTRIPGEYILSSSRFFNYSIVADRSHMFLISVTDGSTKAFVNLTVNITPANHHVDTIKGNFTTLLPEEVPIGTPVQFNNLIIKNHNAGNVRVYSLSGKDASKFNINRLTGDIRVASRLDRDTGFYQTTDLKLTILDKTGYSATASLVVVLQDINDNAPICNPSLNYVNIFENGTAGELVGTVTCKDMDAGPNKAIMMEMDPSNSQSKYLSIDQNGEIRTTNTAFDYEGLTGSNFQLELIILARDKATNYPQKTGTATIIVTVMPVNEFSPEWGQFLPPLPAMKRYDIKENLPVGTVIVTAKAVDFDVGIYGKLTYEMNVTGLEAAFFRLDAITGELTVKSLIDADPKTGGKDLVYVQLTAKDGGGKSSPSITLWFMVDDENDNDPYFSRLVYTAYVAENATVGTDIVFLQADDADFLASLSFVIVSGDDTSKFRFHPQNASLLQLNTVIKPDKPNLDPVQYNLRVQVKDGGNPERTAEADVVIHVQLMNNYSPIFSPSHSTQQVNEDAVIGMSVVTITAADNDSGDDKNLVYRITAGNTGGAFSINRKTGMIRVAQVLDFETLSVYKLTIEASDEGSPPRYGSVAQEITITNTNDQPVHCSDNYLQINIPENASVNTQVAILSCFDQDNLTSVTYKIGGIGIRILNIDDNGHLTLIKALDFDTGSNSYSFDIRASDGVYTTTVPVMVTVIPINEFLPHFLESNITKMLPEDAAIDSLVATIRVQDGDAPPHHVTKIWIENVLSPATFNLEEETGKIRLIRKLDYETENSYSFLVVAIDGGNMKATCTVRVLVEDVNDNFPICLKSHLHVILNEDTPSGTLVSSLSCRDADSGNFGNLTYNLKQTPVGTEFTVNSAGEVILQGNGLDFERLKSYQLQVLVVDGGFKQTSVVIKVDVADMNDGPPRFPNVSKTVSILEDTPTMSIVANMAADDPDDITSPYGRLIYEIVLGNTEQIFAINKNTGEITLDRVLDREKRSSYVLTIMASESVTQHAASATASLTIYVLDVNDNSPECPITSFNRRVKENAIPGSGSDIISFACTDPDSPASGGIVTYAIATGDKSVFILSNNTLMLNAPLDFDQGKRRYSLTITVSDSLFTANIYGSVEVISIDEYQPVFKSGNYSKEIPEDTLIGEVLLTVVAIDQDSSDTSDGIVSYSLLSNGGFLPFSIDSTTGQISLLSQLDWETKTFYSFQVIARDKSHKTSAMVSISVTDINENRPVFARGSYSRKILETTPVGTILIQVSATDADGPSNGNITYSIIDGNSGGEFDIIRETGHIRILQILDYDNLMKSSFTLKVEAADKNGGPGSLTGTTLLNIILVRVNEFPPVFSQNTYLVSVKESEPVGFQFLQLSSSDKDRGPDGDIYYSLMPSSSGSLFSLDSINGQLFLQRSLDFETTERHVFNVTATDMGNNPMSSVATVVVDVKNINDEMPECPMMFLTEDVREDFPTQKTILNIGCKDKDAGMYGQLSFSIKTIRGRGSFSMDNTGNLSLSSSLDYETSDIQLLAITIYDGGTPPQTAIVNVKITVIDVNEAIPVFDSFSHSITIPESAPIGHLVLNVVAHDNDSSETLTFFFTTPSNEFEIHPISGVIRVKSLLDFESKNSFTLLISVADSGTLPQSYSTQTMVVVTLTDVNESPPIFSTSIYRINVKENTPPDSTVAILTVTDGDRGVNAQATFQIVSGDATNAFQVARNGAGNCDVSLSPSSLIDYEKITQYSLLIRAVDKGGLSSEATLVVQVQPWNEYRPLFQNISSNLKIKENVAIGTILTTITAHDGDAGLDGTIFYELSSNFGKFLIDQHSGVITVSDKLDREQVESYQLLVVAKDGGINPSALTSTLSLTVTIEDVNDNDPTCTNRQQHIAFLSENQPIGTSVFQLSCSDSDRDPDAKNNQLHYIIRQGNIAAVFAVNGSTGLLITKAAVDREVKAFYELTIRVSDFGTPSRSIDQIVHIRITDVNDNAPVFSSTNYTASVSESLSSANVVLKVTATDKDVGDAGTVWYSILSGNLHNQFALDSLTGELKLITNLDREAIEMYSLLIQAIDGGSPAYSTQAFVTVNVIDENDNSPTCRSSYYSVSLPENAQPNSPVISLQCTDLDIGTNSLLSYTITRGNTPSSFIIDSTTGNVTVFGNLDAEHKAKYLIIIDVSDQIHVTKNQVEIVLLDINETPPRFTPPGPFGTHVPENAAIGSFVFQVIAKDDDVSDTSLLFSFGTPNKYFNINKITGLITLNDRLDREVSSTHTLIIKVADHGSPRSLSNITSLTVTVDDVNDNSPSCKKTNIVSLSEDEPPSTWIANISCFDVDSSSPLLTYTLTPGNNSGLFEVQSNTGQIFLMKRLDFETNTLHSLDILVDDNGRPLNLYTHVKLIVKVLPVNEHAPTFQVTGNNIIAVMENSSLSSLIAWINATDADEGEDHGEIAFDIESGDPGGHFLIDSKTGKIALVKHLDRESQDSYRLSVTARDCLHGFGKPRTTSTPIYINVTDVNDNFPEFSKTAFIVPVSENVRIGTKLLTFGARDDDIGLNGQVVFFIASGDSTDQFTITNNHLVVNDTLDFRKKATYSLNIQAQDKGVPPLSSYAHVTVHVKPKNDHPPTFSEGNASIVLKEDHAVGSIIYRVNATDLDTGNSDGLNISITHAIPSNAPRNAFYIDEKKGDIVLADYLDYEKQPNEFHFIITALDKGTANDRPLSATMTLSIRIVNINDNPPVFGQNTYSFSVDEDASPNTFVGKVSAVDKDEGSFGLVTYSVVGGDTNPMGEFVLDPKYGSLFVNMSLDFERKSTYVYIIEAVDTGSPTMSSRCTVRISVRDVNDFAPDFILSMRSIKISENIAVGKSVIKMKATDSDSSANGNSDIRFSQTELTSANNYFRIDELSGIIYVRRQLDREVMSTHSLIIYAVDNGRPRLTGSTNISIHISDVNDNSPVFARRYRAFVSEKAHVGHVIFQIVAYDRDEGKNGAVTFEILNGNTDDDFRLDSTSGYLLTNKSLDRERTTRYRIRIRASDRGVPSRSSITDVNIMITDENDNAPSFLSSNYKFQVAENLPASTTVGQLVATDADSGRNALLKYRILFMLTGPNDFNIDGGTGVITSRYKLDREAVPYYRLWCEVTDDGTPPLRGYTEVGIAISDENDHTPTFRKDSFTASISEQERVGTTVINFNITDYDTANFSQITLSILPKIGDAILASHYFIVSSSNQSLILKRQVDRELITKFHFTILAEDGGIPPLSSKAVIDILVGDFNDHDPLFIETFKNLAIAYDGSCTSFLVRVKATDPDRDDNGRIVYYFVRSRYNYLFAINDITGNVSIQMGAERNWIYILAVNAHDFGTPQRISSNNVTLRIDTFNPPDIIASIHLGINRKDFEAERQHFQEQLNALLQVKYPGGRFEIWCIQEREGVARSSPQAMRRLSAKDQPVTVNVYCVKSNTTNDILNIKQQKDFCSSQEVLSFLTVQASGKISGALKGPAWDYFAIEKVNGYRDTDDENWASTFNGKIIIALSCLLILLIVAISIGYCYLRRKRNSSIDPNRTTADKNPSSKDKDELKKTKFTPKVLMLNNKNLTKLNKMTFDGRAIDPASGRLYEYNKLTNESRWVPTPIETTPKLNPRNNRL